MPYIDILLDNLPLATPVRLEREGLAIVVIRTSQGITAFHDRCPHAAWPISEGEVVNGILECPGHGWRFDVTTGQCLNSPIYRLISFDVVMRDDHVRITWD